MPSPQIIEYLEEKEQQGVEPEEMGVRSWDEAIQVLERATITHKTDGIHNRLIKDYANKYGNQQETQPQQEIRPESQTQEKPPKPTKDQIGSPGLDYTGQSASL